MKILSLPQELRPRERLLASGVKALSNAELLAIILRVGNKKENVMELSSRLLNNYDLGSLSRLRVKTLEKQFGIGTAKACQISACFELGRRLAKHKKGKRIKISSAKDVARMFIPEMSTLKQEHCKGIYLDSRQNVIKEETLFVGTLNSSLLHPREIFNVAINESAAAVILIHNHPSGDPTPSEEDIKVTKQLKEAGKILDIDFLDHVIIGSNCYVSLLEEEMF